MSDIAGPMKELKLNLPEVKPRGDGPVLTQIPTVLRISDKHKWIAATCAMGEKHTVVAEMFGVSAAEVGKIAIWDHPELEEVRQQVRNRMADNLNDLTDRIKFHAEEALETTVAIMRTGDTTNKRLAAKDIMDRAGYMPIKKSMEVHAQVPSEEFTAAVERMTNADMVRDQASNWAWKNPVKEVPAPQPTSTVVST